MGLHREIYGPSCFHLFFHEISSCSSTNSSTIICQFNHHQTLAGSQKPPECSLQSPPSFLLKVNNLLNFLIIILLLFFNIFATYLYCCLQLQFDHSHCSVASPLMNRLNCLIHSTINRIRLDSNFQPLCAMLPQTFLTLSRKTCVQVFPRSQSRSRRLGCGHAQIY